MNESPDAVSPDASLDLLGEWERDQQDQATAMVADWDRRSTRRWILIGLSLCWFTIGGIPVAPIGLLIALNAMLPENSSWGLQRRIRFAGRRVLLPVALALTGLFIVKVRVGLLDPAGGAISAGLSLALPF